MTEPKISFDLLKDIIHKCKSFNQMTQEEVDMWVQECLSREVVPPEFKNVSKNWTKKYVATGRLE